MATKSQRETAKENVAKAREAWTSMSSRERAERQPEGRARAKPGQRGQGEYYRIVVRDKDPFELFRTHDVGDPGHIQRVAGRRKSGSWATQAWLVAKEDAHVDDQGYLRGDTDDARDLLDQLGTQPRRQEGDVFRAKPRPDVPESEKPTPAQKKARRDNIKKAQEANQRKG